MIEDAQRATAAMHKRKPALWLVAGLTLLAGLIWLAYWVIFQRHFESTDDAYVQAPVVQITPQAAGTVVAVLADDTDPVQTGQTLVLLDPADARLALASAQAQWAQTLREVRALYANNDTLSANVGLRQAEVARLQVELTRATDDLLRRQPLLASGALGGEEVQHAQAALAAARSSLAGAQSALAAARAQAASNRLLTDGSGVEQHPSVEHAATAVREAGLALQRTRLPAPVAGQVAKRSVQVGQRVAAGTPLMSVIALEQVWVEANFKEVQLRQMRIGQAVKLHADLYGSQVEYDGRVAGVGAGTGAAFALLPAQNATGNWIKVVQRVPVRIAIDAGQLAAHPLRLGLSMQVTVDVADATGAPLPPPAATRASNQTQAFEAQTSAAERSMPDLMASQPGRPASAAPTTP